jgi:hypothetical protein
MNDYKNQHTPCLPLLSDIWNFKACPDGFADWRDGYFIEDDGRAIFPALELFETATVANDKIIRMMSC